MLCTTLEDHSDGQDKRYIVKLRRGTRESAAACVSEVVCGELLRRIGVRTFDPALVHVGQALATNLSQNIGYAVDEGIHFGTIHNPDAMPGPPTEWSQMIDPRELVSIWAADCWLMNIDRAVEGNIALELNGSAFQLIAADQSDCFLGSGSMVDGTAFERCESQGSVEVPANFVDRAIAELGCEPLYTTQELVSASIKDLREVLNMAPVAWWAQSGMNQDSMMCCLTTRAERLRTILRIEHWEGIQNVYDPKFII